MMRLRPASVWCLALAAANAAPAAFSPKFHYQPTESANAVYHLACLASHIPCTKINFERFWHDDLHWTPADQRELDAWTGILTKVADAAPPPKPAPFIGNSASFYPGLVAQREVIRALLESKTLADFQRRARPWLSRDAAARLRTAIEHFHARLKPWLESSGRSTLKLRPRQVEKDLRNEHVLALAAQMAAFVEAAPSIRDVHVHIIPGPVFESDAASATFVSNHIFVEWIATAHPQAIPSLALHELTHYFYDTASAAKHVSLMQQFAQAEIPYASALYAFLNEALACAVQGLVAERTPQSGEAKSDKDVYRHAFIPRLGRSTVPVLKDSLVKRSTLYQGFTQPYIRAANVELGPDITNPKFFLTSAAILPTDRGTKAYEIFLEEVQPVSFIRSDQWKLFPNLNLVFMVAYDELAGFSGLSSDIASHTNRRGFAFMDSRDGKAIVCVIAGRDAGAITDVVKAFVKLPSVPPSGLVLSID